MLSGVKDQPSPTASERSVTFDTEPALMVKPTVRVSPGSIRSAPAVTFEETNPKTATFTAGMKIPS
jgi:hypothetical protein